LAPDPVLGLVGIPDISEEHDWVYTLSADVWPGRNLTSSVRNLVPQARSGPSPGNFRRGGSFLGINPIG